MSSSATLPNTDGRTRFLVTPEGIAVPMRVAARSARLGAFILDIGILFMVMTALQLFIAFFVIGILFTDVEALGVVESLSVVRLIMMFLLWYGYFLVQELGPRGATLGKRIVGIRVAARNGNRLTPEAVVARNLLRDIEVFYPLIFVFSALVMGVLGEDNSGSIWSALIWFIVFLAFPFFNKDALRAGDVIAGTWVVEAPRTKLAEAMSTQGAAAKGASDVTGARYEFGEAELAVYGEHELQTLERILRQDQPEALSAVHETICNKIGWDPGAGDERAFLEAFYGQLRAKLESDMRFGRRKADKFS